MALFKVTLDIEGLTQFLDNFQKQISSDLKKATKGLAVDTQTHIVEQAYSKLKSSRQTYMENLSQAEKIDDYLWEITLKADAQWIEDGLPNNFDMKKGLLNTKRPGSKGEIKTVENPDSPNYGKKYRVVAFDQGKVSSQLSSNEDKLKYQQELIKKVKSELRKREIPYKKLELDPKTGSPRTGKLHSFDIESGIPGKGNTPVLHGLSIYQTKNEKTGKVQRSISTFRTVMEGQDGKWIHPGLEGKKFFEDGKKWAEDRWEKDILPALMEKYKDK